MGILDDAKNKAQDLAGKAKEKVGEVTNNDDLRAEGLKDQGAAGLKDAGQKVKDSAEELGNKVKDGVDDLKNK